MVRGEPPRASADPILTSREGAFGCIFSLTIGCFGSHVRRLRFLRQATCRRRQANWSTLRIERPRPFPGISRTAAMDWRRALSVTVREPLDVVGDHFAMILQGEMAGIEQVEINLLQISLVGVRPSSRKDEIVAAPNDQGWRLRYRENSRAIRCTGRDSVR